MTVLLTGEKSIAVFDKKPTVNSIAVKDPNGKTISSTQLSSRAIFVRCILSFIFQVTCSNKHKILINKNPKKPIHRNSLPARVQHTLLNSFRFPSTFYNIENISLISISPIQEMG